MRPNNLDIKFFYPNLIIFLVTLAPIAGEYYSSVDRIKTLGKVEADLVQIYRQHREIWTGEIGKYRKYIEQLKAQHLLALEGSDDYLANPINAFGIIKRFAVDWKLLNEGIASHALLAGLRKSLALLDEKSSLPDRRDLYGAVKGLGRIQMIYQLNASDLAYGKVDGHCYNSPLAVPDCFEIAANLFDQREYRLAKDWFQVVRKLVAAGTPDHMDILCGNKVKRHTPDRETLVATLEYLVLANYELELLDEVASLLDDISAIAPERNIKAAYAFMQVKAASKVVDSNGLEYMRADSRFMDYMNLCHGMQAPTTDQHKLHCRLDTQNKPIFILAPLKVEELHLEPDITVYYDLLSDRHIGNIIAEGERDHGMKRSEVVPTGAPPEVHEVRVSQQIGLTYESPSMRAVWRIVSAVSGLDLRNAEAMQLANYGIGGQYDEHHDFYGTDEVLLPLVGDRISTNVFYLSDVPQGGYTVFPLLNVYVRPVKGALLVWHNLHRSLDVDARTLHAGCPVIKGTKRIGNFWIHSGFQEFRRPCELKNDKYKSAQFSIG